MLTIARGTLPLALFGPAGYGLRTGLLAAPARILQGGAPLLFGLVLDRGGPFAALLLSGTPTGLPLLALLLLKAPAREQAVQQVQFMCLLRAGGAPEQVRFQPFSDLVDRECAPRPASRTQKWL